MKPRHFAIVAPVGGGKTSALQRVVQAFHWRAAGALSLRVLGENQEVVGYDLLVLPGEFRWPYARRTGPGTPVGRFRIQEAVLQRAQAYLRTQQPALWVIDEVGRLELIQQGGWWPWLVEYLPRARPPVVLTVREIWQEALAHAFPGVLWRFYRPQEVNRLIRDLRNGIKG